MSKEREFGSSVEAFLPTAGTARASRQFYMRAEEELYMWRVTDILARWYENQLWATFLLMYCVGLIIWAAYGHSGNSWFTILVPVVRALLYVGGEVALGRPLCSAILWRPVNFLKPVSISLKSQWFIRWHQSLCDACLDDTWEYVSCYFYLLSTCHSRMTYPGRGSTRVPFAAEKRYIFFCAFMWFNVCVGGGGSVCGGICVCQNVISWKFCMTLERAFRVVRVM